MGTLAIQLAADEMKMIMQDGQTHHISTKKVFFFLSSIQMSHALRIQNKHIKIVVCVYKLCVMLLLQLQQTTTIAIKKVD